MTSERVDAAGVANVAAAAAACLDPAERRSEGVVRMRSAEDLQKWQRWVWWLAGGWPGGQVGVAASWGGLQVACRCVGRLWCGVLQRRAGKVRLWTAVARGWPAGFGESRDAHGSLARQQRCLAAAAAAPGWVLVQAGRCDHGRQELQRPGGGRGRQRRRLDRCRGDAWHATDAERLPPHQRPSLLALPLLTCPTSPAYPAPSHIAPPPRRCHPPSPCPRHLCRRADCGWRRLLRGPHQARASGPLRLRRYCSAGQVGRRADGERRCACHARSGASFRSVVLRARCSGVAGSLAGRRGSRWGWGPGRLPGACLPPSQALTITALALALPAVQAQHQDRECCQAGAGRPLDVVLIVSAGSPSGRSGSCPTLPAGNGAHCARHLPVHPPALPSRAPLPDCAPSLFHACPQEAQSEVPEDTYQVAAAAMALFPCQPACRSPSPLAHSAPSHSSLIFPPNPLPICTTPSPSRPQATFDTNPGGDWTSVFIPWHEFVLVKRARTVPGAPPIDPARIRQFGLVYSRCVCVCVCVCGGTCGLCVLCGHAVVVGNGRSSSPGPQGARLTGMSAPPLALALASCPRLLPSPCRPHLRLLPPGSISTASPTRGTAPASLSWPSRAASAPTGTPAPSCSWSPQVGRLAALAQLRWGGWQGWRSWHLASPKAP